MFEHRIPPPLVTAIFAVLMWLVSLYVPGLEFSGSAALIGALLLVALGAFFALAGVVSFRRARTTVNPLRPGAASALVTTGIYRYTRNPMYLGFALFLLAWAVYLTSPVLLLGVAGFVLYMNRLQIAPEERALQTLFGEEFDAYTARVRRWL